jgi:5-formyltetrahydrofolate cyclo-ligase
MKRELRAQLLQRRNALSAEFIQEASVQIQRLLFGLSVFQQSRTIMLYVSMGSEVATDNMIQESLQMGKRVAIPYLQEQYGKMDASEIHNLTDDLMEGKFNTRVPKPECYRPLAPADVDLIVLPAVAFDEQGNRMGYGGGYYDRYLKTINSHTALAGINFTTQVVKEIPTQPHDMPVDYVIHEQGILQLQKETQRA